MNYLGNVVKISERLDLFSQNNAIFIKKCNIRFYEAQHDLVLFRGNVLPVPDTKKLTNESSSLVDFLSQPLVFYGPDFLALVAA